MKKSNFVKITLVGAGGMAFGPTMIYDAVHSEKIKGATLILHDLNEDRLKLVETAGRRMNKEMGEPINIEATLEPKEALEGADFVIISAEKRRFETRKQDYEVPLKYNARHIMGENGGPGAVFHSLRSINVVLSICKVIEEYCPNAFVINLNNPMSRVTMAIAKHTRLKVAGLCHEFFGGILRIAVFLLIHPAKIDAEAYGVNHFTWFHKIRHSDTGKDLYPALKRHVKLFPWMHEPLVRDSLKRYGLYSTTVDSHLGEYLPYARDIRGLPLVPYHQRRAIESEIRKVVTKLYAQGLLPLPIRRMPRSYEETFKVIEGMVSGEPEKINAINVVNNGSIPNLENDVIVEVPATVDSTGIHPQKMPQIIEPLAEIIRVQHELQCMVVEAVVNKDVDLAFKALCMDPQSPKSEKDCRRIFNELYELQADLLPF